MMQNWRNPKKLKMIIKEIDGVRKLLADEDEQNHILIVGQTGSTKTLLLNRLAEEYHSIGYIVVHIESAKSNLEPGWSAFEPTAKYHLDKLKFQNEKSNKQEIRIYHPNIGVPAYKKVPETQIYTLSIKKLDRLLISFLFEESSESSSISILNNEIEQLKKSESFFDLFLKLKKGNSKEEKDLFSLKSQATSINFNTILNYLSRFRDQPILMPDNYEKNLDIVKALSNQKPYHIFSNRWVNDEKLKSLFTLYIISEIRKAKQSGKIKRPVLIILDELKSIANASPLFSHNKILSKILTENLSIMRSLSVNFLASSQLYNDIDSSVRQSFSEVLYGKSTALNEIQTISQILGLDSFGRRLFTELEYNQFYFLSQDSKKIGILNAHLPRHANQERGEVFDRLFGKQFPDKMKNYKEETKKIMNDFKMQEERVRGSL